MATYGTNGLTTISVSLPVRCYHTCSRNFERNAVRVLIVDDHEAVRKGVCAILSSRLEIEVCGEAANGKEAIEKAEELKPDLIIMDVTMPVLGGLEATREIRKSLPEARILMLSMHDSKELIAEVKKLGAMGYVGKAQAGNTLLKAVDTVMSNQLFYPEYV
jgi:two-component system, NarL family, nitrate/nitrite response regulator NarL